MTSLWWRVSENSSRRAPRRSSASYSAQVSSTATNDRQQTPSHARQRQSSSTLRSRRIPRLFTLALIRTSRTGDGLERWRAKLRPGEQTTPAGACPGGGSTRRGGRRSSQGHAGPRIHDGSVRGACAPSRDTVRPMPAPSLAVSLSPNGNLEAVLEQDDRCAYLYLREVDEEAFRLGLGVRSCWVRNLEPAPPMMRIAELRDGVPAMMPAPTCAHPKGAPRLEADAVRFVW